MDVATLRELFRNLEPFRALYETERIDVIEDEGQRYCLWDIEYLYEQRLTLSKRQREAIELHLVQGIRERKVAEMMGLSPTNPIGMYATKGLERIVEMIETGQLPRYQRDRVEA